MKIIQPKILYLMGIKWHKGLDGLTQNNVYAFYLFWYSASKNYLDAFSLTSEIDSNKLQGIVSSIDGKANQDLEALSKTVIQTDQVGSIKDLKLEPREGNYQVPAPLKPYRDAIQKDWDSKGRFNGPVIIATGDIKVPIRVIQGGYYDFAATKLADQPAKLVPDVYREGQTVEDVLNEHGVSIEERAKYFGFAHMMWPSNGKEFLFIMF